MDLYNKLSLLSVPSGYKINRSFNIKPFNNTEDFDFTRSTTATRVNSKGIIEVIAVDILRLDYAESLSSPSLLLERSSTNLITYSEDFSQWSITSGTMSRESGYLSPDGTNNAYKINGSTSSRIQLPTSGLTVGEQYTFSIYLKADAAMDIGIGGIITTTPEVSITTEWKRYEVTQIASSTTRYPQVQYTGDLGNVYIWGAQLEQRLTPTSYIPTNSIVMSREEDSFLSGGDSNTFSSEGVLFYEAKLDQQQVDGTTYTSTISLSNGDTINRLILAYNYVKTGSISYIFSKMDNVPILNSPISSSLNTTEYHKVAIKYKAGDYGIFVNGIKEVEDTNSQAVQPMDRINFSSNIAGSFPFFGRVKMVGNISGSINDSELVDFTNICNTKIALIGPSSVYKSMYIPGMPGNTGAGALDNRVKFNRFENLGQIQKYNSGVNGRDSTELIYTVGDIDSFPSTGSANAPTGSNYTGTDYDLSLIENLNLVNVNFGSTYNENSDYGTPIGLNNLVGSLLSSSDPMDASLLFKLQNLIDLKPDIMVCNIAGVNKYANSGFPSFSGKRQKTQNQIVNASVLHTKIIIDLCRRINCKVVIIDTTTVGRNFSTPTVQQLVITNVLAMSQELEAMVNRYQYPESDVVFANVRDGDYGLAGLAYTSGDDIYLTKDEYVVSDNLHYNEAGYEIYANIVYKAIERLETLNNKKYLKIS
tara:strand:+ start:1030 stop:3141 length:2112 start_codon:yes stop_codon:yes gene_type:complete